MNSSRVYNSVISNEVIMMGSFIGLFIIRPIVGARPPGL